MASDAVRISRVGAGGNGHNGENEDYSKDLNNVHGATLCLLGIEVKVCNFGAKMRYTSTIAPRNVMKRVSKKKLNQRQELFCRYFAGLGERRMMANATASYIEAYSIKESKKSCAAARRSASELLTNPDIKELVNCLFEEQFNSDVFDNELLKVALQDVEWGAKVQAIREFNRLKGRVTNKLKIRAVTPKPELSEEQLAVMLGIARKNLSDKFS